MQPDQATHLEDEAPRPQLPPQYELHRYAGVDSTVAAASRLARDGADEGTLVWADNETAAPGRLGGRWEAMPGGLYAALVLRPEVCLERALQLSYVALLSLGRSVAELLPGPMTMRYRWPNDLLLADAKAGAIQVHYSSPVAGIPPWLVIGVAVNPDVPCEDDGCFPAATMRAEKGTPPACRLLERFGRHFLSGINRWDTHGFAAARREWLASAEEVGDEIDVRLAEGRASGRFVDIDDVGRLVLETADGHRRVPLSAAFPAMPSDA